MLLVDDILKAPVKGVLWILREVAKAAEQEQKAEAERIKEQLRELYMRLEQGRISEADFDTQEVELLDRLDSLEGDRSGGVLDEESEESDDDEDDADAEDTADSEGDEDGDDDADAEEDADADGDTDDEDDEDDDDDDVEYATYGDEEADGADPDGTPEEGAHD